jgi:outer membrane protein OmpA-like peptidoglycan-associated protein
MQDPLDFKKMTNPRISARMRHTIFLVLAIMIGMLISMAANAQYQKENRKFFKSRYKSQTTKLVHACDMFSKRSIRKLQSKPKFFASHKKKSKVRPMAEVDPETLTASVDSKPYIKRLPKIEDDPVDLSQVMDEKHTKEDEVLEDNHLPVPTSEKHELIRKQVAEQIKNNTTNEPVELAPLYFTFDEDEFAVVDMEPFLIAVEYALQGKTILIEGHTDSKGNDSYNMQLSIKRVQKIRELMHDMGVSDEKISVVGYGEQVGGHDNSTEAGRQNNRRVDFKAF